MLSGSLLFLPSKGCRPPGSGPDGNDDGSIGLPLDTLVLIVEDAVMIAWTIESLLEDLGFTNISIASTCEAARNLAKEAPPGFIVSDINLGPGADGIDTAIAITRAKAVPVLFVTGYADEAARMRIAANLSRADLISKPIGRELLLDAIRRLLAQPMSQ